MYKRQVVICAGANQKPTESRLQLLQKNAVVFSSILPKVVQSGFEGIFLVATNPVDIMTLVTYELSGFNASKIIGTGTTLDTALLRYLLGEYFEVDPRNIHAYVTVSYTHLDVYKRQTLWSIALPSILTVLTFLG